MEYFADLEVIIIGSIFEPMKEWEESIAAFYLMRWAERYCWITLHIVLSEQ